MCQKTIFSPQFILVDFADHEALVHKQVKKKHHSRILGIKMTPKYNVAKVLFDYSWPLPPGLAAGHCGRICPVITDTRLLDVRQQWVLS